MAKASREHKWKNDERNAWFNDKQSQIAERKTGDQQRPGERSKNAAYMTCSPIERRKNVPNGSKHESE
jgi:hypothetical protein